MSKPADRARRAAATQSCCARRMSSLSIALGTTTLSRSLAICDGASCTSRDSRPSAYTPPCHSWTPASAPCSCALSVISDSARASSSSQRRAETYGVSSDSCVIEQYSVHTAAQPPSAFMPRKAACVHGFSTPKPVQCGTW